MLPSMLLVPTSSRKHSGPSSSPTAPFTAGLQLTAQILRAGVLVRIFVPARDRGRMASSLRFGKTRLVVFTYRSYSAVDQSNFVARSI